MGDVNFLVLRDAEGLSAAAFCRAKGFGDAGGVRSAPLRSLAGGVSAVNLGTLEQCVDPECQVRCMHMERMQGGSAATQPPCCNCRPTAAVLCRRW